MNCFEPRAPGVIPVELKNGARVKANDVAPQGVAKAFAHRFPKGQRPGRARRACRRAHG